MRVGSRYSNSIYSSSYRARSLNNCSQSHAGVKHVLNTQSIWYDRPPWVLGSCINGLDSGSAESTSGSRSIWSPWFLRGIEGSKMERVIIFRLFFGCEPARSEGQKGRCSSSPRPSWLSYKDGRSQQASRTRGISFNRLPLHHRRSTDKSRASRKHSLFMSQ